MSVSVFACLRLRLCISVVVLSAIACRRIRAVLSYSILHCTTYIPSYTVHRTPYCLLLLLPYILPSLCCAPPTGTRDPRRNPPPATCVVCARARPVGRQRPPTTQSQAHHHTRHTLRNLRRASQSQLHTVPGASSVLAPKWRVRGSRFAVRGSRCVVRGSRISGPGHGSGCCVSDTVTVGIYYIYIKHGCGHWHQEIEIGEGWLPPRVFVRAPARRPRRR